MTQRRGVSLIELIVVIATSGVVMSVGVWTLSMLMRSERGGAERLGKTQRLLRGIVATISQRCSRSGLDVR